MYTAPTLPQAIYQGATLGWCGVVKHMEGPLTFNNGSKVRPYFASVSCSESPACGSTAHASSAATASRKRMSLCCAERPPMPSSSLSICRYILESMHGTARPMMAICELLSNL